LKIISPPEKRRVDKFNIVLTPKAVKDLDGFNDKQCKKILDDIRLLEENPFPRGKLIKKIKGTKKNYYRLRIDKYRVFFRIQGKNVFILRIMSKKDVEKIIKSLN